MKSITGLMLIVSWDVMPWTLVDGGWYLSTITLHHIPENSV